MIGWFKRYFAKKKAEKTRYKFTDEDTRHSNDLRRINAQIKQAERQMELLEKQRELEDLQESMGMFDEEEENDSVDVSSPEAMFMTLMMNILNKNPNLTGTTQSATPQTASYTSSTPMSAVSLSNEQIKEELRGRLKQNELSALKTLDDASIESIIKNEYPSLDNDTLKRAVVVIREN